MSDKARIVVELLARYHNRKTAAPYALHALSDHDLDYLVSSGLGPIAFQLLSASATDAENGADATLRSAHLTTWVIYRQMQKAAMEILQFATAAGIEVVLLKGVSIGDELYASPHHRIMGDIDLLVRTDDAPRLSELLKSRGYQLRAPNDGPRVPATHHHLPELRHPDSGVSVEIHTSLVSRTVLADDKLNQPEVFRGEIRQSTFQGIPCQRFSPEYQIVYTLMHWSIITNGRSMSSASMTSSTS
jgi:predicted Fe-Mo cluster-binding NifX family protein